ncbi:VOC family protein [Nitrosomonas aestuarii]|nr:VOC family protein [Nitrosomonas aestuarii]
MRNPTGWFEIYVEDISRAKQFYEAVFAVKLEELKMPDTQMYTFPMSQEGYGASGAIVKMVDCPSGGNSVLVYFSCDDCAVEEKRVAESNGKIIKEKFSIGDYGFISLVTDTEGNMIGLHSMK